MVTFFGSDNSRVTARLGRAQEKTGGWVMLVRVGMSAFLVFAASASAYAQVTVETAARTTLAKVAQAAPSTSPWPEPAAAPASPWPAPATAQASPPSAPAPAATPAKPAAPTTAAPKAPAKPKAAAKRATPKPKAAAAPPPAPPAPVPTAEQAAAIKFTCSHDARSFCSEASEGSPEGFACLQRNSDKLSADCRTSVMAVEENAATDEQAQPAAAPAPASNAQKRRSPPKQ
jgi:hypothetical protein